MMTASDIARLNALQPIPGQCGTVRNWRRGCTCLRCGAAGAAYDRERKARRAAGEYRGFVDAGAARKHLQKLSEAGIGYRVVAEEAQVAVCVVCGIKSGRRARCRADVARRILAVQAKGVLLPDSTLVDGASTWKLIDELVEAGYRKRELAAWFYGHPAKTLQFRRDKVKHSTKVRIRELYEAIIAGKMRRD